MLDLLFCNLVFNLYTKSTLDFQVIYFRKHKMSICWIPRTVISWVFFFSPFKREIYLTKLNFSIISCHCSLSSRGINMCNMLER